MIAEVKQDGNKWRYRFYLKLTQTNEIRKTKGKFPTQEAAQHALEKCIMTYRQNNPQVDNKLAQIIGDDKSKEYLEEPHQFIPVIQLNDVFQVYITSEEGKKQTPLVKALYMNHIAESSLGKQNITDITTQDVVKFLNTIKASYSDDFVNSLINLLYLVFEHGVNVNYLSSNPMDNLGI